MRHSEKRPIYHLVYATKHVKGLDVAKNAMWNASRSGEYSFSDSTDPGQQVLIDYKDESVWGPLAADYVFKKFRGKEVPVERVEEYVLGETPYLFKKKAVLKRLEMESPPKITRVDGRERGGTYPKGCKITFA